MKTQAIQNIFKMMIGTSALIASTAFFINTISPVQASENKLPNFEGITSEVVAGKYIYVVSGTKLHEVTLDANGKCITSKPLWTL